MQDLHENHNVSILMVTHDAFSASYCERILFIQDGLLYKELNRQGTRENFYQDILGVLAHMGSAAESK
ncbi:bacitracin ABC transporter ATP-binding protein, partial [Bacillus thuringiensis]|nr:bacitracin ABC transporter ATP-binding protein [Bacillus thuringiensis]CJI07061.1 lantibiotic ABC transporter ATP-binding protein [Streptococcus pneumoniae]